MSDLKVSCTCGATLVVSSPSSCEVEFRARDFYKAHEGHGTAPKLETIHPDTVRLDAVEKRQWNPRCVEFHQWQMLVSANPHGHVYVSGTSVRDVIDKAIAHGRAKAT